MAFLILSRGRSLEELMSRKREIEAYLKEQEARGAPQLILVDLKMLINAYNRAIEYRKIRKGPVLPWVRDLLELAAVEKALFRGKVSGMAEV